jgi:hypothetical protein
MHIDEKPLLLLLQSRLGLGNVTCLNNVVTFSVNNRNEIKTIIEIFTNHPLNTTKLLNFIDFKKAFELYENSNKNPKLINEIFCIKAGMNKSRTDYTLANQEFQITPH